VENSSDNFFVVIYLIKHHYYRHLEDHFRSEHFICEDPICIAQKYKVYLSCLELTTHQIQAHPFIQLGKTPSLHGSVTFKTKKSQAHLKQARKAGRYIYTCLYTYVYSNFYVYFYMNTHSKRARRVGKKICTHIHIMKIGLTTSVDNGEEEVTNGDTGVFEGGMGGRARRGVWQVVSI
jgi:hypothetical protein